METNYVGSSPTVGIFIYVAKAVERLRAVAFRKKAMLNVNKNPTDATVCRYLFTAK